MAGRPALAPITGPDTVHVTGPDTVHAPQRDPDPERLGQCLFWWSPDVDPPATRSRRAGLGHAIGRRGCVGGSNRVGRAVPGTDSGHASVRKPGFRSTTEGADRNRTGVRGFAGRSRTPQIPATSLPKAQNEVLPVTPSAPRCGRSRRFATKTEARSTNPVENGLPPRSLLTPTVTEAAGRPRGVRRCGR